MVPGQITLRVIAGSKDGWVKIEEGSVALSLVNPFAIDLWRDHHEHAKYQRQQQPFLALADVAPGPVFLQGKPDRRAGNEEEKRHSPLVQEIDQLINEPARFVVLYMPLETGETHAGVKQHENAERNHPEPIEIVSPVYPALCVHCHALNRKGPAAATIMSRTAVLGERTVTATSPSRARS